MSYMGRLASLLPEHVDLCSLCGCAPILPEAVVLTTPKWVFKEVGDCYCADPMESPSEGFAMDYRHELHDYLVEKGEREE